jgi:lipid-A-disaccharide synthase
LGKNKIFLIAGERSGDLHGGNLVTQLKIQRSDLQIIGWGGDDMQSAGMLLLKHYKEIAMMGIWEVIRNIRKVKGFLGECKKQILEQKPDAVILIDYGGFNMKIAKFCKENNISVHYYISPKVWAWNTKRAFKIKEYVDFLYCILPFEPKFFQKFGYETQYVGNPVVDAVRNFRNVNTQAERGNLVAILPGSRYQEVSVMLDLMVEMVSHFPNFKFVVTAVNNLESAVYDKARKAGIEVVYDKTYEILSKAKAALVTSGTATLETAMFGVPQVVCYKTSAINYQFAKFVLKVPYISLVNLIADKEVVKELIQHDYNFVKVKTELDNLLNSNEYRNQIFSGYQEVEKILGTDSASEKVASLVISRLADK